MKNLLLECDNRLSTSTILYQPKLHWTSYFYPIIYVITGSVGIIPLFFFRGILQLIALLLVILFCKGILMIWKNRSIKIFVTEGHLTISYGIFTKTVIDVTLDKMEGMQMNQSLLGNILDFGNLTVNTGMTNFSYNIQKPIKLRNVIITRK